jgi:GNAT superfamily N-acetyltransferase
MTVNINIRLAEPEDALSMAEVLTQSWEAAYSGIIPDDYIKEKNSIRLDHFKEIITTENKSHYVILSAGVMVGLLSADVSKDNDVDDSCFEVGRLYIHPDYFRRGIGTTAMEFAYDIAFSLNKTMVTLWVLAENASSIKFYKQCGFAVDGRTQTLDYGKPLECIRMRKDLIK